MKIVLQIILWIVIAALGYLLFNSVYGEVKFNELKEVRYQKSVEKLKDIRDSQLAYKQINGRFAKNFDELVTFIDTASYVLTQRRDTTVLDVEQTKAYGVDSYKEIILTDTLGYYPVKDSLFKGSRNYKSLKKVPIKGIDADFEMEAGTILKNDIKIPVFEAKVAKDILLHDQPKDYVMKEKQVISVDGVNGAYLSVGSMTDISTNGNWPKSYDDKNDQ